MQNEQINDLEYPNREEEEEEEEEEGDDEEEEEEEETESQNHDCDNAWQSASTDDIQRWKTEKDRYDEFIQYIHEVDEILNLIKPFPREDDEKTKVTETGKREIVRSDSQIPSSRFGLDHLENVIKLVEQLKELQDNNSRPGERAYCLKDLRKLREHKKRLKNQELEFQNRVRHWNLVTGDDVGEFKVEFPEELTEKPSSPSHRSKSKKPEMVTADKEKWQDNRKSLTLSQKVNFGENKSKISKWTKVKEAFHWERTSSVIGKPVKREIPALQFPGGNVEEEAGILDANSLESAESCRDHSPEVGFLDSYSSADLPPPPPSPPRIHSSSVPTKSEDLLSVRPIQDFPSSSSSDKMDELGSYSEVLTKENKNPDPESPSQLYPVEDNEDTDNRARKSSSEELMQFPQYMCKDDSRLGKSNKTTWGKVKDIIQTRKDSLKKKPKKRGSEEFKKRRKLSLPASQFSDQFEDLSSPEEKYKNVMESVTSKSISELSERPSTTIQSKSEEKPTKKKHPPSLTITMPSTEELRNFTPDVCERRDVAEDKLNILSHFSCQAQYCEDKSKYGKTKSGQNQRMSRWVKVKRVFLTSTSPPSPSQCLPKANLSPGSQNKSSGFFSDMESDEVSSSEWIDDKLNSPDKLKISGDTDLHPVMTTFLHEDVRKSYRELQKKLSHEFEQKLREWEMKSEGFAKSEDFPSKSKPEDGDTIPKFRKTRDSIPVPLPNLNDLSPEFKKKLNDWKKMKTSQSTPSVSSPTTKEEIQSQNIKIRIGEWQPWRSRYMQKAGGPGKCDQSPGEDYSRKLEDGQKTGSGGLRPPSNRRKEDEGTGSGGSLTGKRDSKTRDSIKKITHSRLSSGGESVASASSTEKEEKCIKRSQKVKDFHWVEKELQKIEREKLRLEQEREKYLEREARLEQMKRTMETTSPAQEILVRTPTGVFRFKGISQKFTKKLYEWEKARGIAPEASTFALLEESVKADPNEDSDGSDSGTTLQRSKSMGSVPEMTSSLLIETMAHHPSSLSLNDVEELKILDKTDDMDDSMSSEQVKTRKDAEPEAIIVDVEDVVEETALLADSLLSSYQSQIPVYTFASEEVHRLADSAQRFSSSSDHRDSKESKSRIDQSDRRLQLFEVSTGKEGIYRKAEERLERNIEMKKTEKEDEEGTIRKDTKLKDVNDSRKPFLQHPSPIPLILEPERELHILKTETGDSGSRYSSTEASDYKSHFLKIETRSNNDFARAKPDSEALKKRIKEKITLMQSISTEGKPHTWKLSDSNYTNTKKDESSCQAVEEIKDVGGDSSVGNDHQETTRSVNVFVPTTRKIISPVQTNQGTTPSVFSYVIDDVKPEEPLQEGLRDIASVSFESESRYRKGVEKSKKIPSDEENSRRGCQLVDDENEKMKSRNAGSFLPLPQQNLTPSFQEKKKLKSETTPESERKRDIGIPPLPNSPKAFRKLNTKETAPSIRMIIAKYNQKISEHETPVEKRGESASPTIWRSPVFGRRTQEKIEKYFKKNEGEVQKSASYDNVTSIRSAATGTASQDSQTHSPKGILKSSSVGIMKNQYFEADSSNNSSLSLHVKPSGGSSDLTRQSSPSVLRALRIKKAKEDFLSGRLSVSSDASPTTPTENSIPNSPEVQLTKSQTDTKTSETGKVEHVTLAKSVSAETITSEKNETQNENFPDRSLDGRALQKSSSKFDISSIKSKFRKIRMRKEKESKASAVSVLCRQSLLIEVPKDSEKNQADSSVSKSCPSSPVMDRNKAEKPEEAKPSAGSSAHKRKKFE